MRLARPIAVWPVLLALAPACTPALRHALQRPGREADRPAIRYTLEPLPSASGEPFTRVRMSIENHHGRPFLVRMPVWTPGEYRLQNHARNVRSLRVVGEQAGAVTPADGGWRVEPRGEAPVELEYELGNARPGVFSENVDVRSRHAFYDGAATFLYVEGRTREPVGLRVIAPAGWQKALCPLDAEADGTYRAETYEELVDSPILVGERVERAFDVAGKPHTVAFYGAHRGTDYDGLAQDFRRIVEAARGYMGGLPYRRYVLYLDMNGRGGGLEHSASARLALPSGMVRGFAARFVAHEFFHLWNVKRIRPAVLGPFDFSTPAQTRNLWFCEGVTEYVAGLLTLRAGLASEEEYLQSVASSIQAYYAMRGRTRTTPETASLRIWEEGWSSGYGGVSVYTSGEVIGLCLDLQMLHATGGRAGLRELMRDLMEHHAPPKPGYDEDGIRAAAIRVGGQEMGTFYDRLVRTTAEPPLAQCLGYAGLTLERTPAGFTLQADPTAPPAALTLRRLWLSGTP